MRYITWTLVEPEYGSEIELEITYEVRDGDYWEVEALCDGQDRYDEFRDEVNIAIEEDMEFVKEGV